MLKETKTGVLLFHKCIYNVEINGKLVYAGERRSISETVSLLLVSTMKKPLIDLMVFGAL